MTVLHDPLALSRQDYDHDAEERWITLGMISDETLVVVVHTYEELSDREVIVRIISARRPTKDERFQYQSGNYRIQDAPPMREQYNFSGAVRGKFYRKDAVIGATIELEASVLDRLSALAEGTGKSPSQLIGEMLDRESAAGAGVSQPNV